MAEALDLTGQRFGNLTVIERAENNKKGNTQWLCKCDCGKQKIALGYDLKHGRTTTCGCAMNKKGIASHNRVNLVGNRYGKLVVTSLNEELSNNGILVWNCKCDCGNTFTARGGNLKNGKATHCGCNKSEFPPNFIDLTNKRFGRLVVLGIAKHEPKHITWNCKCDCGNEIEIYGANLRKGNTKSCGCYQKEQATKIIKNQKRPAKSPNRTHGLSQEKIYYHWTSMKSRCKPNYHNHNSYYDKGVKVCDEWKHFEGFRDWAYSHGYNDNLTLDRIDYNGNYEPDNCRWVNWKTQANNKSTNVFITIDGKTKTLKEWSDYYGLNYGMVKARHRKGWSTEELFKPKIR